MRPWDFEVVARMRQSAIIDAGRGRRLVRTGADGGIGPVQLAWIDESCMALVEAAIARGVSLNILYPASAEGASALLAAQFLIGHFIAAKRSERPVTASVGILTAAPSAIADAFQTLAFHSCPPAPISSVFPVMRAHPDGSVPLHVAGRPVVAIGKAAHDWKTDLLIIDHCSGPVRADAWRPTAGRACVRLFSDPLDPELAAADRRGEAVWGWSPGTLCLWNEEAQHRLPGVQAFSVGQDRLRVLSKGVHRRVVVHRHAEAEEAIFGICEAAREIHRALGDRASSRDRRGLRQLWGFLRRLTSLPCSPSEYDAQGGFSRYAALPSTRFADEVRSWARSLPGEAGDYAAIAAVYLGDLRTALERGNPLARVLAEASDGPLRTVALPNRAAVRAVARAFNGDTFEERAGSLDLCTIADLRRHEGVPSLLVVGQPHRTLLHLLDSGVAGELEIHVIGRPAAAAIARHLVALDSTRSELGGLERRTRTWKLLIDDRPPAAPLEADLRPRGIEILEGLEFIQPEDPFAFLSELTLDAEEGEPDSESGDRAGYDAPDVEALRLVTDAGVVFLAVHQRVDRRKGSVLEETPVTSLRAGDVIALGRCDARLGLLETLERQAPGPRRAKLATARKLSEWFKSRLVSAFQGAGITTAAFAERVLQHGCKKSTIAIASWLHADGPMAPRDLEDLAPLCRALGLEFAQADLKRLYDAVMLQRTFRRRLGHLLAKAAQRAARDARAEAIDAETGLTLSDLRDAVVEVTVRSLAAVAEPVPAWRCGRLIQGEDKR